MIYAILILALYVGWLVLWERIAVVHAMQGDLKGLRGEVAGEIERRRAMGHKSVGKMGILRRIDSLVHRWDRI